MSLAKDKPRGLFLPSLTPLQTLSGKWPSEFLEGIFKFTSNICKFHCPQHSHELLQLKKRKKSGGGRWGEGGMAAKEREKKKGKDEQLCISYGSLFMAYLQSHVSLRQVDGHIPASCF